MKSYTGNLSHYIDGNPEPVMIAFLRSDGLVILDGKIHSTIPHARIAAGCPLLICDVLDNDSFVDLEGVRNVEIPE